MKRIIIALLLMLSIALLASCTGNNPPDNVNTPPADDEETYTVLIRSGDTDLSAVVDAIYAVTGKMVSIRNTDTAAAAGEIIFGDTDRPLTDSAIACLDDLLKKSGNPDGYVAYKANGSIAVYWNEASLADAAISRFITDCIKGASLKLKDGILFSHTCDRDAELEAEKWADLEATAPADIVKAFKDMADFYNKDSILEWLANLWDPELGAFYFANSSRDYEGFLPDIESTQQLLAMLTNAGLFSKYGDSYGGGALPEEIGNMIVDFVRSKQDKDDGYFYHPQWGKGVSNTRKGRDMTKALSILSHFGAEPLYPTALDNIGNYDDAIEPVAASLTSPLGRSTVVAVSRVIATAGIDSRFESLESFDKWLKETTAGIKENSHNIGHTLSSSTSQIKAAGFLDHELDYLDSIQEEIHREQIAAGKEPTGLFDLNLNYGSASGLYKIAGIYNNGNRQLKYADLAAKSCIDIISIPHDDPENPVKYMVYPFNPWNALDRVLENIEEHHENADLVASVNATVRANGAQMIYNTMAKLAPFQKENGAFSYYPDHAAPMMQGVYISLGLNEADVTSTGLAMSLYRSIYETMGYKPVNLYGDDDRLRFISIIESLTPVEKLPTTSDDPIDFSDGDMPINVSPTIQSGGSAEVAYRPGSTTDYALHYLSYTAANMDNVTVKAHGVGGNLYVFESDIRIDTLNSESRVCMQLKMGSCYIVELRNEGGKVVLYDNPTTANTKNAKTLNITADFGEWFNLRIEYYLIGETVKIKAYKNGSCTAISENYMGSEVAGTAPSTVYDFLNLRALKAANVDAYFDNIVATCTTGEFSESEISKDYDVENYDFENMITPPQPSKPANDRTEIVADPTDKSNKMLSYAGLRESSVGGQSVNLIAAPSTKNAKTKTVSFDFLVPSRDLDGDGVTNEYNGDFFTESNYGAHMAFVVLVGGSRFSDLRIMAEKSEDGVVKALALSFNNGKDDIGSYTLRLDTKYSLSVTYDFTSGTPTATLTVNGESYLTSTSLYADVYASEGGITYSLTSMKRTKGAVYFDNIVYTESEELLGE